MIIQIKKRNKIELPNEVYKSANINKGDYLDVQIVDGNVVMTPVSVKTRAEMEAIEEQLAELKERCGITDEEESSEEAGE